MIIDSLGDRTREKLWERDQERKTLFPRLIGIRFRSPPLFQQRSFFSCYYICSEQQLRL